MINECDLLKIGKLAKPHGIKGKMAMTLDNAVLEENEPDFLFFKINGLFVPFCIEEYDFRNDYCAMVKFEGIDNIENAKKYQGLEVYCEKSDITTHKDESEELAGYDVSDEKHGYIGKATWVDTQTENILLFVENTKGEEIILPFHDDLIASIDKTNRTITFKLPDGIIGIDNN